MQSEPINKKRLYLGTFMSLMISDTNRTKPIQESAIVRPNAQMMSMEPIRKYKQKTLLLSVVSKPDPNQPLTYAFLDQKTKKKQLYIRSLQMHGYLIHCFSEIWCFLLYQGYVKMKVIPIKNSKPNKTEQNMSYSLVKVTVYLNEQAIKDTYELKILRYRNQRLDQDSSQEEQIRFGRLSLLLVLDFMCIKRSIPSLVKSQKQFKIFFSNLAHINNLDVANRLKNFPQIFKDNHQLFIDKLYFEEYMSNQQNKLFDKHTLQQIVLFQSKNISKKVERNFVAIKISENLIHDSYYFNYFIRDLFQQFRAFIKRSSELVLKAQRSEYSKFCFESIFLDYLHERSFFNTLSGFHNNELYKDKLSQFIHQFNEISQYCKRKYMTFNQVVIDQSMPLTNLLIENFEFKLILRSLKKVIESKESGENQEMVKQTQNEIHALQESLKEQISETVSRHYRIQNSEEEDINQFLISNNVQEIQEYDTPKTMKCVLKRHQKQALTWMLYREQREDTFYKGQQKLKNERQLSPLWEEITLIENEVLYVNTFTGKMQEEFPKTTFTRGGILADEMGLGKTIMALALILQTKKKNEQTLIVVPKSVLLQWEQEIKTHTIHNVLKVLTYYKKQDRKKNNDFLEYDIILTTYQILAQDYTAYALTNNIEENDQKQKQVISENEEIISISNDSCEEIQTNNLQISDSSSDEEYIDRQSYQRSKSKQKQNPKQQQIQRSKSNNQKSKKKGKRKQKKRDPSLMNLLDHSYCRVILDEAHNIKHKTSQQAKGAFALQATYRWCLTGTPMQNKHDDLFSLICFLKVETFGEYFWWNTYINKEENEDDQQQILNQILQPILLRRLKRQETELKQVQETIHWVELNEMERILYQRFFKGTQNLFSHYLKKEENNLYIHVFQIINKLRMTCDHPQMALKDIKFDVNRLDQMLVDIDRFLQPKQKGISEKYRADLIEKIQNGELQECTICTSEEIITFGISKCGHVFCKSCFDESIKKQSRCPSCRQALTNKDLFYVNTDTEQATEFIKEIKTKTSSKLEAVVKETQLIQNKKEKCLVFTQWMDMIELLTELYRKNDIYYLIITGSMTTDKRQKVIKDFQDMPHITALVLSLRATSTGLNLTMANHVFIVDPWWNPAIEEQAIGRADRIGQQNQVNVIRFLCKDTIEHKINILHQRKKQLVRKAISNEQKKQQEIDDFKFLLLE